MKVKILKAGSVAVLAMFGALAVGCASTGDLQKVKATAQDAQQTAQQAMQTAQQANQTAMEAKSSASDAQSTANQALSLAQQNAEKMNRMYQHSQRK